MASDQAMPGIAGTPDLLGVDQHGAAAIPKRSLWGLIAISLFWLALNFHWTALLIVILPSQVEALLAQSYLHTHIFNQSALSDFVNSNKAVTLALVTSPGLLVALVSNPLFGMFSDRTASRWGRRRPYIVGGTLLNVVGLFLMMAAPNIITLMLALCLTQLGNNAAAAPFHAYLPDLVNKEQRGTAAGIMGLAQIVGIILGALVTGLLLSIDPVFKASSASAANAALSSYSGQLVFVYGVVAFVMFLLMLLTSLTVKELSWQPPASKLTAEGSGIHWFAHYRQQVVEGALALALIVVVLVGALLALQAAGVSFDLNGAHLAQSDAQSANNANIGVNVVLLIVMLIVTLWATRLFDFRPRRDPDFAWVAGTRLLVMLGINTVQAFLQYYFHDVLGSQHQEQEASTFVIILTLTAALTTFFGGWLSNRYGRKRMVYISGGLMSAVAVIFVSLNFLTVSSILSQDNGILIARLGGAIFGLGYGAYLSVDWALVADVLPSKERYARDMGIWNIALTVPQVVAFVIGSILLSIPGSAALRYTLLFVVFAIYALAGTITVRFIKAVKR
jgi:MFS family permease